jgi:hypothetical protein
LGVSRLKNKIKEYEIPDCLACGSKEVQTNNTRYFVVPGFIMVPNEYLLCKDHKHVQYFYEDIFDENGNRKKIDHASVIERSEKRRNINE